MRWSIRHGVLVLAVACSAIPPTIARASCGADNCPLDMSGHQGLLGRFSFDLSYQYSDMDRVKLGTRRGSVGELPSLEDEVETETRTVSVLAYARLSDRLKVTGALPYVDRMHRHIANEPGQPPELLEWNYSGLGDLTLIGQWSALGAFDGPGSLTLQLGAKLPTGKRHVDAVDGQEPEPSARPGTGSTDGIVGAHYMHRIALRAPGGESVETPFFAGVLFRAIGRGTDDYRVGNETVISTGGGYPLTGSIQLIGQLNARIRAKDQAPDEEDPSAGAAPQENTGGTAIYATPGLRVGLGSGFSAYGYFQFPLYERVNRIQLVAPYHIMLGTTYGFGL